jgi:hypothetical protein
MKVDLDKEEMTFLLTLLSAAIAEAVAEVDEEICRSARRAGEEDKAETLRIRNLFRGIKCKMDCGIVELEER